MASTKAGVDRPTRAGVESVKSAGIDKKKAKGWKKWRLWIVRFLVAGAFFWLALYKWDYAKFYENLNAVSLKVYQLPEGGARYHYAVAALAAVVGGGFLLYPWQRVRVLLWVAFAVFASLIAVGEKQPFIAVCILAVLLIRKIYLVTRVVKKDSTIFGKARPANLDEIYAAGFNHQSGLYVGEYFHDKVAYHVFYGGDCHAITQAPNRSGKGRTVLIPHLAHYSGSMVVNDIKGENAYITAKWRRDRLGQKVYILNPYGLFEKEFRAQGFQTARFNPLASFDPSAKDFILRIDTLAADLVKSHDPRHDFWTNSARQLVGGYLRFLVETKKPADRNICDLYGFFKRAQAGGDIFMDELRGIFETCSAGVRDELGCLQNPSDEVLKFINSAVSDLAFMRDPALRASLSGDDFDFRDFKRTASTLYIIAPPDGVQRRDMWLRLVVASGLSLLGDVQKGRGLDTLFLLDESAVLGYMESIASRYALLAGYGVRFWLVFQSLGQVKEHYPKQWESFLDNAGFAQFFTPNNMETAEYISKRAGNRTVSVKESLQGVPLWSPQDVLGLPRNQQIIFAPNTGGYPIAINRGNYDENPVYEGLNPNPYVA